MKHCQRRALLACALAPALQSTAVLAMGLAGSLALAAPQLALAGRMGEKALLMIDGQPQVLAVGQMKGGVKLLRWEGEDAVLQHESRNFLLRVGGSPVQLAPGTAGAAAAREIVISAGPGGHFITGGAINGRAVQFMVDTGATRVALSQGDAQRLGLDMRNAQRGMSMTANGPVPVQQVVLSRVRVGELEITNVEAVVLPAAMPHVLLGNSFLSRFQMRRDNDVMRLAPR